LIVIAVAGLAFGEDAARGAIFAQLRGFLGDDGAQAIEGLLKSASLRDKGVLGTAIGVVLLLAGATTVLAELQRALDRIWRAPERNKPSGGRAFARSRLLSLGMILGIGSERDVRAHLQADAARADRLARRLGRRRGHRAAVHDRQAADRAVPRQERDRVGLRCRELGGGAALWVYYSAQIFLIGAEFTWVYAHRFGSRQGREQELEQAPPRESDRLIRSSGG
jgi:membrane protein